MTFADSVVRYINADEMHAIGRFDGRQKLYPDLASLYIAPELTSINWTMSCVIIFGVSRAGMLIRHQFVTEKSPSNLTSYQ
jgi:hypothetical protein